MSCPNKRFDLGHNVLCSSLTSKQAIDFLDSNELLDEVNMMCEKVRSKVTGVPLTIIDGKWCVQGGQSSEIFIQVGTTFISCSVVILPSRFICFVLIMRSSIDLQETSVRRSPCCTFSLRRSRCGNWYTFRMIATFLSTAILRTFLLFPPLPSPVFQHLTSFFGSLL